MTLSADAFWKNTAVVSAILSGASVLSLILSVMEGKGSYIILSSVALGLFALCAVISWMIANKYALVADDEDIVYFRLKRPGVKKSADRDIVPKGKMPRQ